MSKAAKQVVIWAIGLLVTGVMIGLGLWQQDRFETSGIKATEQRLDGDPQPLQQVAEVGGAIPTSYGTSVTINGRYLPEQQILVPVYGDADHYRVLTAFQFADGSIVPVVRGVVQGTSVPAAPSGTVTQTGYFRPTEAAAEGSVPTGMLGSVRPEQLVQLWQQPMYPGFVSLIDRDAAAQGLAVDPVALPNGAGEARNRGYALQWWIFAGAAVVATIKLSRDAATDSGWMAPAARWDEEPETPAVPAVSKQSRQRGTLTMDELELALRERDSDSATKSPKEAEE
ncbi:SURF1 family protein [Granulicoccus phenolivorans]|uniref:SURF1 family protein n=1 Tax=Granulicoccus phenolivorans TaxID=266854 RepID=UPI000406287F|nr:SURF1 family protein [Granulicoccus phenolivorans]